MEKERKRIAEMCKTQKCLSVFGTRTSTGDTDDRHWYPHAEKVQPKSAMRTMQFVLFYDSKTCP